MYYSKNHAEVLIGVLETHETIEFDVNSRRFPSGKYIFLKIYLARTLHPSYNDACIINQWYF